MNWPSAAAESHYKTALLIQRELKIGHIEDAAAGMQELIDALSRSEKRELRSQLIRLMVHVLKWHMQPDGRSRSWSATIINSREEIADIQEETPSLSDDVIRGLWDKCFRAAVRQVEGETNLTCPITQLTWQEVFVELR